jgi:hypothetical protein
MGPGPHWTGTASLRRTTRSWQGRRRHARMPCSGGCAADYPARFEDQPIVSGLTASTTAAYAPDGRLFIAEKGGRLEAREPGESAATTILDISHKVNDSYDRGLLGLPSIASSRAMATSICSTSTTSAYSATATVRWSRGSRGLAWTEQTTFRVRRSCSARVSGPCPAPSNTLDRLPADNCSHAIGPVVSAPQVRLHQAARQGLSQPVPLRAP